MKKLFLPLIIAAIVLVPGCSNKVQNSGTNTGQPKVVAFGGPDAIIYKTKADYHNYVPVILNKEKTEIVSFPAPGDLTYRGEPSLPTELENGFLLDNRGINANVAFLSISYPEYMAMEKSPTADELMGMILDKDPLTEMYDCGKRQSFKDVVGELKAIILANDLGKFKRLK